RLLHAVELPQRENSTSDHTGFSGGLPSDLSIPRGTPPIRSLYPAEFPILLTRLRTFGTPI
ncbi:hypothetical protein, partial [Burkholderia stagnalis]|uniref:hypothetical protein n=1 Tax=Burkholderia stagnalis TaxID=1503054 RepID=UPI001E64C166